MEKKLHQACKDIEEKEPMNNTFYSANLHAIETKDDYIVPKGVRIIMFCYSGRKLFVCPKFDKFNWYNIFTNPELKNYCSFILSINQYSSIRNHFCIYDSGSKIKNLRFGSDKHFTSGIFKLPIQGAVRHGNNIYSTDLRSTSKVLTTLPKNLSINSKTNIKTDRKKASKYLMDKDNKKELYSKKCLEIPTGNSLSMLVEDISKVNKEFTLLLLTCREGDGHELPKSRKIRDEVQLLYNKYVRRKRF